jgi:hypothetical protein
MVNKFNMQGFFVTKLFFLRRFDQKREKVMKATLASKFKYLELFLRPKYGDMFPIEHFIEMVEEGCIIPEDGILIKST